jgi:hypothetical protein
MARNSSLFCFLPIFGPYRGLGVLDLIAFVLPSKRDGTGFLSVIGEINIQSVKSTNNIYHLLGPKKLLLKIIFEIILLNL